MLVNLSTRLDWAKRSIELPAGRYETPMPPSTVADMMIYLGWSMDGRGAQEGRTALSAPGGGTKIIDTLASVYLTASATVLNTGIPSICIPPLPGVTPATMLVPYSRHCFE